MAPWPSRHRRSREARAAQNGLAPCLPQVALRPHERELLQGKEPRQAESSTKPTAPGDRRFHLPLGSVHGKTLGPALLPRSRAPPPQRPKADPRPREGGGAWLGLRSSPLGTQPSQGQKGPRSPPTTGRRGSLGFGQPSRTKERLHHRPAQASSQGSGGPGRALSAAAPRRERGGEGCSGGGPAGGKGSGAASGRTSGPAVSGASADPAGKAAVGKPALPAFDSRPGAPTSCRRRRRRVWAAPQGGCGCSGRGTRPPLPRWSAAERGGGRVPVALQPGWLQRRARGAGGSPGLFFPRAPRPPAREAGPRGPRAAGQSRAALWSARRFGPRVPGLSPPGRCRRPRAWRGGSCAARRRLLVTGRRAGAATEPLPRGPAQGKAALTLARLRGDVAGASAALLLPPFRTCG